MCNSVVGPRNGVQYQSPGKSKETRQARRRRKASKNYTLIMYNLLLEMSPLDSLRSVEREIATSGFTAAPRSANNWLPSPDSVSRVLVCQEVVRTGAEGMQQNMVARTMSVTSR